MVAQPSHNDAILNRHSQTGPSATGPATTRHAVS